MDAAVAQLAVVEVGLLGTFACQFCHSSYCLAVALVVGYLLLYHFGHIEVFVQVVVDFGLDEVAHKLVHTHSATGFHGERAELDFRLAFKLRFLNVDGYSSHDAVAYVYVFVVLAEEFLYGACYVFLECTLVCTSLYGVLSVDKRVVLLAILLVGVCECNLDVVALEVYDVVEWRGVHGVDEQVFQSVSAHDAAAVVVYLESGVEVCVVAQHGLHKLCLILVADEQRRVGTEVDVCTGFLYGVFGAVVFQHSFLEACYAHFAVAIAPHLKFTAQCVHGFGSHSVQSHTLLECLRVVLASGVEHAHGLYHLALWYATAEVADAHAQSFVDVYLYALACVHLKLVD